MSASIAEPLDQAAGTRPIFTGGARWVAAVVLVTGGLLQAIEFLLDSSSDDNVARVAFWAEHPAQIGLSMACGVLAIPFLLGAVAVLVALTRADTPRLAWASAVFMTFAMVGLAAVHGYELSAYGLALAGNHDAATAVLAADDLGLPGAVMLIMFLGGATLGTLSLVAAVWRSPRIPRIAALFMLAFAVLDFAFGQGVLSHLVNLVGFAIVAFAVITGYTRSSHQAAQPAMQ